MKDNKRIFIGAIVISLVSLLVAIILEFHLHPTYQCFLSGHGDFITNICIGVFASGILLIGTSYIQYCCEKNRLVGELLISYAISFSKFDNCKRNGYVEDELKTLKGLLDQYKEGDILFSKEFSPIFRKLEKNDKFSKISVWLVDLRCRLIDVDFFDNKKGERHEKYRKEQVENCHKKLSDLHQEAIEYNKWLKEKHIYLV